MVPLISSMCQGPLGVCQLPRTWLKMELSAKGLLDGEYPGCSGGLDTWVIEALELDKERTLDYLTTALPSYPEFEEWVLERKGGKLNRERVEAHNERIRTRQFAKGTPYGDRKIAETYGDIGFDESVEHESAVLLNCMQDWQLFYQRDYQEELPAKLAPLIGSIDYGELGLRHLPRLWLKGLLKAKGVLAEIDDEALDTALADVLGLTEEDIYKYLAANQPSFREFESWIRMTSGSRLSKEMCEAFNQKCTVKEAMASQLRDWQVAHAMISGTEA